MTGEQVDQAAAVKAARKFPGLKGMDLAKVVTTKQSFQWNEGSLWPEVSRPPIRSPQRLHVVAYDFGIKRNILRLLADGGCRMTVVPAKTTAEEALALEPDGVVLSNGPGDPEPSPGPHDLKPLFERFNHLMLRRLQAQLRQAEDTLRRQLVGGGR